jgi:hypothetical protein
MQPYRPNPPKERYSPPQAPGSPSHEKESHIGVDYAAIEAREAADGVLKEYEENQAK